MKRHTIFDHAVFAIFVCSVVGNRLAAGPQAFEPTMQLWKEVDISRYQGSFVSLGELNGDGKVDFLLSQMGPHTTPIRLVALDHEGRKLWELGQSRDRDAAAGVHREPTCRGIAAIYDVDRDGQAEVLAELWQAGRPMFCLIEGATGKIRRRIPSPLDMSVRQPQGYRSSRPVPMALIVHANGPGQPPIIVAEV